MASNPSGGAPIEQGQPHPTTTSFKPGQQEGTGQLGVEPAVSQETEKADQIEKKIEPKATPKTKPSLMISIPEERTKAWVETQIAPKPVAPITSVAKPTTPREPSKQTETEKNTPIRKNLVVGLTKPPAKQTPRKPSTTDRPPLPRIYKGPGLSPASVGNAGRIRKPEEPKPSNSPIVNAQNHWNQLGIEGEARFNIDRVEYRESSSPLRSPMPMPGTPRRRSKNYQKPKIDKEE